MARWIIVLLLLAGPAAAQPTPGQVPILIVASCGTGTQTRGVLTITNDGKLCTTATSGGGTITAVPTDGTGGQNSITVTNSSAQLLAARVAPQYALSIKNESATASIAVCFGACTAALNTAGSLTLSPGQLWSASTAFIPLDAINGISGVASSPATIQAN